MPEIRLLFSSVALRSLVFVAATYAALSVAMQLIYPSVAIPALSPLEISIWIACLVALVVTMAAAPRRAPQSVMSGYWPLVVIATIAILKAGGLTSDWFRGSGSSGPETAEYLANSALAIVIAAGLLIFARPLRGHLWLTRALLAAFVFQLLALLLEFVQSGAVLNSLPGKPTFIFSTELAELLCIEFYVVAMARTHLDPIAEPMGAFLSRAVAGLPLTAVGTKMRLIHQNSGMQKKYHHPPIRLAYWPVFQELTLALVTLWLAARAGPGVKAATGKPIWRQAHEMLRMWFEDGIDPPSYYAQELYRPDHQAAAGEYLTRFETKNGLLSALNKMREKPNSTNEMGHKELFSDYCERFGIPHPQLLMTVTGELASVHCNQAALHTDLFCKMEKGMGAIGTQAFRFQPPDRYSDDEGRTYDLAHVVARIAEVSNGETMLVQPWLRNHPDIADLAKDSLITFRVVTCLDEHDRPEVTLAMLRVLAKLEPDWPEALDEEYAAAIDLQTGRLGLFTGDNMTTSPLRYEYHPLTGAKVLDRIVSQWPAIRDTALTAHAAFPHRVHVGWDIALTPQGPVVLEGNTNLDVMFLQRVQDLPAGRTRFGELISHHLDCYVAKLPI